MSEISFIVYMLTCTVCVVIFMLVKISCTELAAFLKSITGSKNFIGKTIYINFHKDSELSAFSISTCGYQIDVSTLIEIEESNFMASFKAITIGNDFTMPWLIVSNMHLILISIVSTCTILDTPAYYTGILVQPCIVALWKKILILLFH